MVIEYDLCRSESPARDYCIHTAITYTVGLSALFDYAETLDPSVWPPVYPSDGTWLCKIFTPYIQDAPEESLKSPSYRSFFISMHAEFVSDWFPKVRGLRDHINGLVAEAAESDAAVTTPTTAMVKCSEKVKAPTVASRPRVSIAAYDSPSEESFDPLVYRKQSKDIPYELVDLHDDLSDSVHSSPSLLSSHRPSRPSSVPTDHQVRDAKLPSQRFSLNAAPIDEDSCSSEGEECVPLRSRRTPSPWFMHNGVETRAWTLTPEEPSELAIRDALVWSQEEAIFSREKILASQGIETYERRRVRERPSESTLQAREALLKSREEAMVLREELLVFKETNIRERLLHASGEARHSKDQSFGAMRPEELEETTAHSRAAKEHPIDHQGWGHTLSHNSKRDKSRMHSEESRHSVNEPSVHTPVDKSPFQRHKKGSYQELEERPPRAPTVHLAPRGGSPPPSDSHNSRSSNASSGGKYYRGRSSTKKKTSSSKKASKKVSPPPSDDDSSLSSKGSYEGKHRRGNGSTKKNYR